ncbi:MAG: hypothetical protein ACI9J3_001396 [Parvicellaceae bacterium]|jgi:hypothetical protein
MTIRIALTLLTIVFLHASYGQNDLPNRESYVLTLPVDGVQFFEQKIESSPFFVHDNILQIYPGEFLFVEIEIAHDSIIAMKVVKENLNPKRTITVEFKQNSKDKISESMMLTIMNPTDKDLEYKAMMFIVGNSQWLTTSVYDVKSKLRGIELWNDVIITLALSDWKLK